MRHLLRVHEIRTRNVHHAPDVVVRFANGWIARVDHAAEKYAEEYFSDDPCNPNDFDIEVIVNNKKFHITAEPDIRFYIREKE